MNPHPYKLRPYHNPGDVDESKVPAGWRFRYEDETRERAKTPCRRWLSSIGAFGILDHYLGMEWYITYIVPVTP